MLKTMLSNMQIWTRAHACAPDMTSLAKRIILDRIIILSESALSAPKNNEMARFGRREGTREARQGRRGAGTRTSALVPGSG